MADQRAKCEEFARLHEAGNCFVIPNPWDLGSAKILEGLGFKALATTSSGFAYSLGQVDGAVSLERKLDHCRSLARETTIPINADFENGFAENPKEMADNIRRLLDTGVAGLSIEDFSRDNNVLYGFDEALERICIAADTIKESGLPVLLTARAENLLRGVDDLHGTIDRLMAYSKAGADVLYAPGLNSMDQLKTVCDAIDKPFNVLVSLMPKTTVNELSKAGAARISTGGALTWAALAPLMDAGNEMLGSGGFDWLDNLANPRDVQRLLS